MLLGYWSRVTPFHLTDLIPVLYRRMSHDIMECIGASIILGGKVIKYAKIIAVDKCTNFEGKYHHEKVYINHHNPDNRGFYVPGNDGIGIK